MLVGVWASGSRICLNVGNALEGGQHLGVAEAEGVALADESDSDDSNAQVARRAGHGGGSFRIVVNRRAE